MMIFLLPFAAGGFLYIAASDLVPELHKEREKNQSNPIFHSISFRYRGDVGGKISPRLACVHSESMVILWRAV